MRHPARRSLSIAIVTLAGTFVVSGTAHAAPGSGDRGAAIEYRDNCGWGPDPEVPGSEAITGTGITEFIPATYCKLVFTPSGRVNFVIRGLLPEGTSVHPALVDEYGTVVTPSGRISGTGSFYP
jgi:hypothetical protein